MISIEEIPIESINDFWSLQLKYLVDDDLPEKYHSLIIAVLEEYASGNPSQYNIEVTTEYAKYMLGEIQKYK